MANNKSESQFPNILPKKLKLVSEKTHCMEVKWELRFNVNIQNWDVCNKLESFIAEKGKDRYTAGPRQLQSSLRRTQCTFCFNRGIRECKSFSGIYGVDLKILRWLTN